MLGQGKVGALLFSPERSGHTFQSLEVVRAVLPASMVFSYISGHLVRCFARFLVADAM